MDEDAADAASLSSSNYADVILTAEAMLMYGSGVVVLQKVVAALIRIRALGADDIPLEYASVVAWSPHTTYQAQTQMCRSLLIIPERSPWRTCVSRRA